MGSSLLDQLKSLFVGGFNKKSKALLREKRKSHIFLNFDHDDVYHWVEWVSKQNSSVIDKAYGMIVNFLNEPLTDLGAITYDAVVAMAAFRKFDSCFPLLEKLTVESKEKWGQLKNIDFLHEKVVESLLKVDQEKALERFKKDLDEAKGQEKYERLQLNMLRGLKICTKDSDPALNLLKSVLLNSDYRLEIRREALLVFDEIASETTRRKEIFSNLLDDIFDRKHKLKITACDSSLFTNIFDRLKTLMNVDRTIWQRIMANKDEELWGLFVTAVTELIADPAFPLDQEKILAIFAVKAQAKYKLKQALASRMNLSDVEQEILAQTIKTEDLKFNVKGYFGLDDTEHFFDLKDFMKTDFARLENLLPKSKETQFNSVAGKISKDKVCLAKNFAAKHNLKLIYVNAENIIHHEIDIKNLEKLLSVQNRALVYLHNVEALLGIDLSREDRNNLKEFNKVLQAASAKSFVYILADIAMQEEDLLEDKVVSKSYQSGSRGDYKIVHEMAAVDIAAARKLFGHYLSMLPERRIDAKLELHDLVKDIESKSIVEVNNEILEYLEVSLLVFGSTVAVGTFMQLQNKIKEL